MQEDIVNTRDQRGEKRAALSGPARTPRRYLQADAALVLIGLNERSIYHVEYSGPNVDSIVPVTKAYTEIDGMKYRQIPFSYRIARASNFEDCQLRLREPDPAAFLFSPFDSREKKSDHPLNIFRCSPSRSEDR
ncbi:MAG TPA: hypothetical protein DEV64_01980 [Rhodospirillaceae bacterium]|nr:hypothetical protein [Rhodospirillaceae bacterium]